jgi:CheY-like chemotaxis protein
MNEPQTILMVDDDKDILFLMRAAFEMAKCDNPLQEVHNGEEAIAYLKGEGVYADRHNYPWPTVMLLDLKMPRKNGFDVLTWVRTQPGLKRLTIFIMSASMREADVERAFDLGTNSFLVKPGNLTALTTMVRRLCDWIQINQFPSLDEAGRS